MSRRAGAAVIAACLLLPPACVSDRSATGLVEDGTPCIMPLQALAQGAVPVLIRDLTFLPETVHVRAGGSVVWINCEPDAVGPHTATALDDAWGSPLLQPGEAFVATFAAAGDHDYFCLPHSAMRGVVRVE